MAKGFCEQFYLFGEVTSAVREGEFSEKGHEHFWNSGIHIQSELIFNTSSPFEVSPRRAEDEEGCAVVHHPRVFAKVIYGSSWSLKLHF